MLLDIVVLLQLFCAVVLADQHTDRAAVQSQERELAKKWGRPVSTLTPVSLVTWLSVGLLTTNGIFQAQFAGLVTFAHLPYTQCLNSLRHTYDIAIIGAPYDTGTTYRSGE
jgi:hypothetical protein